MSVRSQWADSELLYLKNPPQSALRLPVWSRVSDWIFGFVFRLKHHVRYKPTKMATAKPGQVKIEQNMFLILFNFIESYKRRST